MQEIVEVLCKLPFCLALQDWLSRRVCLISSWEYGDVGLQWCCLLRTVEKGPLRSWGPHLQGWGDLLDGLPFHVGFKVRYPPALQGLMPLSEFTQVWQADSLSPKGDLPDATGEMVPGVLCVLNLHSAPNLSLVSDSYGVKLSKILTLGLESLTWQFQSKVSNSTFGRSLPRYLQQGGHGFGGSRLGCRRENDAVQSSHPLVLDLPSQVA